MHQYRGWKGTHGSVGRRMHWPAGRFQRMGWAVHWCGLRCRRKASADKDLMPIIEESRKKAGLFKGQAITLSPEEMIQFIFFPVVNEGCRVIDEGIVDKPSDLDVATVMSMGFPAYRCTTMHGHTCDVNSKATFVCRSTDSNYLAVHDC